MFLYLLNTLFVGCAYGTFSIVAVDLDSGIVGSAGGSCIANSIIISDIHPGIGVIHTQSYWMSGNQQYASTLMDEGHSPNEIIELLQSNDLINNPSIRQYGVVDMFSGNNYGLLYEYECNEIPNTQWEGSTDIGGLALCTDIPISRSASFTGENCSNWKGHIDGINYAIQGNILLNDSILINMENNFINTNGTLDQKLMAALQGAKVPGADTRCLDEGISTLSAFIRVAKSTDVDSYYMDLNIDNVTPYYSQNGVWIDPVDTLQIKFNNWYQEEFEFDDGDVNQDNIIDVLDIIFAINAILGNYITGLEHYLLDINNDNNVNIQDIILLINIVLS